MADMFLAATHTGGMVDVLIRDLSDESIKTYVRRAEQTGCSLEDYLKRELILLAKTPTNEELVDRIKSRGGDADVGQETVTHEIPEIREDRERQFNK
jgi:hypothetical protein